MTCRTRILANHRFHQKTDAELIYIFRDASAAALAVSGHDEAAERKYLDQANDAATIMHYRRNRGARHGRSKDQG